MIVWVNIPLPPHLQATPGERIDVGLRSPVIDPSAGRVGKVLGAHVNADGSEIHARLELDEGALTTRLAERRAAF